MDANQPGHRMGQSPLKALVLLFLWGTLIEDAVLFGLSWLAPEPWFQLFHHARPGALESALLRRAGGQWLAFALVQGIALWRWRAQPLWLVVVAGARISDLFTDVSYILAVPFLTAFGWFAFVPLPLLNALFVAVMWRAYRRATAPPDLPAPRPGVAPV